MVDDNSDEMLGSRLDSALRAGLDLEQVDVDTLVQGSRQRARRIRTRRIAVVSAAAVLLLGAPVGYEVINPGSGTSAQSALIPSGSGSGSTRNKTPVDRPSPVPSAAPSAVAPSEAGSGGPVPTAIPDGYAFTAAELPAGLTLDASSQGYRVPAAGGLVGGQDCTGSGSVPTPAVGRQWVWAGDQAGELAVSLTVTGWPPAAAATAFTAAVDETGHCRWSAPQQPRVPAGVNADQTWASTSDRDGQHDARALIRVGGRIVGIEVRKAKSTAAAAALADRLARIQVARLHEGELKLS